MKSSNSTKTTPSERIYVLEGELVFSWEPHLLKVRAQGRDRAGVVEAFRMELEAALEEIEKSNLTD